MMASSIHSLASQGITDWAINWALGLACQIKIDGLIYVNLCGILDGECFLDMRRELWILKPFNIIDTHSFASSLKLVL